MIRLTLAQMRRSAGRLAAGAIAIVLGTAFLTATLLASGVLERTTYDAVTPTLADADLVVVPPDWSTPLTDDQVRELRGVDGVDALHAVTEAGVELVGPAGSSYVAVQEVAPDPRLDPTVLVEGHAPRDAGEIVLPDDVAERLGLALGDTVTARTWTMVADADGNFSEQLDEQGLTVTGLQDGSGSSFFGVATSAVVTGDRFEEWLTAGVTDEDYEQTYGSVLLAVADGTDVADVSAAASEALDHTFPVRTQDEQAQALVAEITGDANQLTAVIIGFVAVALLVAGLVVANTFQVLVAQRTRTLALLRCVGAGRGQLRRSVVLEAVLTGAGGAVGGILLGLGAVQATLAVLNARGTDVPLPATAQVTLVAVLVPLAVGVLVTVLAALVPARAATRVSPLAALQPAGAPQLGERAGRVRAWVSGLLAVGGLAGLGLAVVAAREVDLMVGLGLGLLAGTVSFVGVLVSAVFWVPRLMALAGRLTDRTGNASARLAAANSARNPRRTAATSSALLIGVTLVVMMATGAAATRVALQDTLDDEFPVDLTVATSGPDGALPGGFVETVRTTDGVADVATLTGGFGAISGPGAEDRRFVNVVAADPAELAAVVRTPDAVDRLAPGTAVVGTTFATQLGVTDGERVTVWSEDETSSTEVQIAVTGLSGNSFVLSRDDAADVLPALRPNEAWVQLTDLDRADDVIADVEEAAAETAAGLSVGGAASERAFYQRTIDTLLTVVVGLLGVAVVISLVGVANTLSLSVLERRRESATLRALGLSRRQLRATLAVEGVLIAVVGAVAGIVLGAVYGWLGSATLLAALGTVPLTVPWGHVGVVLVVAVLAGLLASALPARSAARTPPVEALAVD